MWIRKRIDIRWSDLAAGFLRTFSVANRSGLERRIETRWSHDALVCLSVRSGFHTLLRSLDLPRGSEVLMTAVTIHDMVRIVEHHGLVPVPVDLDVARMAPTLADLRRAVSPATRAIVVAHLFGTRIPLEPILEFAREHGLLVIEDCAQAFAGQQYLGDADADASMFSFGPIKTSTALGGAVLRVRDRELRGRIRRAQSGYPLQSRWAYLRRTLKYSGLKVLSTRPWFTVLVAGWRVMGWDYDRMVSNAARGFAGPGFFQRIEQQPSSTLLAVLQRRLRYFDERRLRERTRRGGLLANQLQDVALCPGTSAPSHTFWVFPVIIDNPRHVATCLQEAGFDATLGHSLCVVEPPDDRPEVQPDRAKRAFAKTVYLPFGPTMPVRQLQRMAEIVMREAVPVPADELEDEPAAEVCTPEHSTASSAR